MERVQVTGTVFATCEYLMEQLQQGWQIEPPVYVRATWQSRSQDPTEDVYHFVVWRGGRVNLISVADGAEVQQFLSGDALIVDRLRAT